MRKKATVRIKANKLGSPIMTIRELILDEYTEKVVWEGNSRVLFYFVRLMYRKKIDIRFKYERPFSAVVLEKIRPSQTINVEHMGNGYYRANGEKDILADNKLIKI